MFKRITVLFLCLASLWLMCSCGGEKKIVHCDKCGGEIEIDADSAMEEDWIIYCEDCNKSVEAE